MYLVNLSWMGIVFVWEVCSFCVFGVKVFVEGSFIVGIVVKYNWIWVKGVLNVSLYRLSVIGSCCSYWLRALERSE